MFINQKILKFLILFICFSISPSISPTNEDVPLNNMAISENPKVISSIIFEDFSGNKIDFKKNYHRKLVIINFWATWCAPCKKEMPSLDKLYQNSNFKNLEIITINIEQQNKMKAKSFFNEIGIKKLKIYFDKDLNFVNEFKLRGIPTTVLVNKKGEAFAKIIGEVNFQDKKFLKWLSKYD